MRQGPSTKHKKVGKLSLDSTVFVMERRGDWARIAPDRWVHNDYLFGKPAESPREDGFGTVARVTAQTVNIYHVPGPGTVLGCLKLGDTVNVFDHREDWVRVWRNPPGWVANSVKGVRIHKRCCTIADSSACYPQYSQQNYHQEQSITYPVCNKSRGCTLQPVGDKGHTHTRHYEHYQVPFPKGVEYVPQSTVHQPRRLPVIQFLAR